MSTRRRLIQVAAARFARGGYEGATVCGIAREAGVTPEQVRDDFSSRKALFGEALAEAHAVLADLRQCVDGEAEGLESFVRYVEVVLSDARGRQAFHLSVWGLVAPVNGVRWPQPGFLAPFAGLIEAGQRDGSISRRHEPELLTLSVLAVVIQAASPLLETPDPGEVGDYVREALRADAEPTGRALQVVT